MTCTNLVEYMRKKGIYSVALETTWYLDHKSENAINYTTGNYYHSLEAPHNTLTIDFTRNVLISSYEISAEKGNNWLLNWKLEFSFDKNNWNVVDLQDKDKYPSDCGKLSFLAPLPTRYARFTGTKTCIGNQYFVAKYVKFYGKISTLNKKGCTCKRNNLSHIFKITLLISIKD